MRNIQEEFQSSVQKNNQNHQCLDIKGFCMKISCDSIFYCQQCQKKFHSKHSQYCNQIEKFEQILQNKLNDFQQLIADFDFLQEKVQSINLFFKNTIETQQKEINQILFWIKDLQFSEIQNKITLVRQIYHDDNKNIKCIQQLVLAQIINIELKQYIEQISNIEIQWNNKVQLLMKEKQKQQRIYIFSDDSDITSSSSSEEIENDRDEQIIDNFKIKKIISINQVQNQQQDQLKISQPKKDQQVNEEQIKDEQINNQQQQSNVDDEDLSQNLILSENLMAEAQALMLNDENNQALQLINESLEIFPNNLESIKLKQLLLFMLHKYQESIIIFDQVIKMDKNCFESYKIKGRCLAALKRYEEAIICYDEFLSMNPNNEEVLIQKAHCLQIQKKYEQCIFCAKKISENLRMFKFAKLKLIGESLYFQNKYEEALEYTTQAVEINQNDIRFNILHSFILIRLKKFEAALNCLKQQNDYQWENILLQSSILRWLKRFDEAFQKWEQALSFCQNSYDYLINNEKNLILNRNSDDQSILFFFEVRREK